MRTHDAAEKELAGGRKPKGKAKLTGMHIRKAKGGYISKHEVTHEDGMPGPGHGAEQVHSNLEALKAHLDNFEGKGGAGADGDQEEQQEEEQAGVPAE